MRFGHGRKCASALGGISRVGYFEPVNTNTPSTTTTAPLASDIGAFDLTGRAPRSPRVQLGGYVILARCLDKGRAAIADTLGEYHFDCPLDHQFLDFAGIDAAALREQLATGKTDGEILAWVQTNARHRHTPEEIEAWARQQEKRAPQNDDQRAYFAEVKAAVAPDRTDIASWFELLDVDDHVCFGGRA